MPVNATGTSVVFSSGNVNNGYWIQSSEYTSSSGTGVNIISHPMTSVSFNQSDDDDESGLKPTKGIHPKLIFKYTKSRLTKPDLDTLKQNLSKLRPMIVSADIMGQRVLFEELSQQLAVCVKEQEALAIGCGHRLPRELAKKYTDKCRDKVIRFEPLEKFPRMIPERVRNKIIEIKATDVFDEYWVLFIDESKQKLQSNKDKIKEKDPILFGCFKFNPETLYYITDWIDEYCDLTMSKLVGEIKIDDPEFALDRVPDVDQKYVDEIVAAVRERARRLEMTKASNYKELMVEEDRVKKEKEVAENTIGKRVRDAFGRFMKRGK
jgi:hypothetical protein